MQKKLRHLVIDIHVDSTCFVIEQIPPTPNFAYLRQVLNFRLSAVKLRILRCREF